MGSMQRPFDAQISEACAVVTPLLPDDGDWESNRNSWYAWCTNEHVNLNRNRLHTNYIVYERTCEPWWKTNYTQNVKAMDRNWNATCGWGLPSTSCSVWKHVFEIAITGCTVLWFPPHILMTCVYNQLLSTHLNISESENNDVGVTLLWGGMIVWPRCESEGSVPPGELYVTLWHCCCCLDPIKLSNSPSCQIFTREIFESSKLSRFQIV